MTQDLDSIFAGLNEQQKLAVETLRGPVLILAGAGSGKTRTLTHRIAHLMAQGVPAWQILAVTFTNKAAREMKERIGRILKISDASGSETQHLPVSGTFHSVCARILRRDIEQIGRNRTFVIYDTDDQEKVVQQVLRERKIAPEELKPRAALGHISAFKSEAVRPDKARSRASTHTELKMADIYFDYQKKLLESNALDFDDLLLETVRLFEERPDILQRYQNTWKFIHVDEYQDTNRVQYLIVSLLAKTHRNLCVIGDPDQSIYAFRGADIRNILDFQREYSDAVAIKLERNYRSTQQILDAADAVIAANPNRPDKKMWTDRTDGAKVALAEVMDERREAEEAVRIALQKKSAGIPLSEQAILYRTNAQSRLFEEACLRAGVPYRILGGMKFYARKEVKDVLAYLYTILNPSDTVSLLRIINVPSRKIGETTLSRLQNFCNERSLTLWQAIKHIGMVEGIAESAGSRIAAFGDIIDEGQRLSMTAPVSEVADWVIRKTGMEKWLRDDTEEGEGRWENVLELLSVTKKYDSLAPQESLTGFLEEVALISEVDKLDVGHEALTLMTLHLCKGLEFRCVSIVGCEEGLLPHSSATFDRTQMEEERRLLYVGMTRARDFLTLLHAQSRTLWGNSQSNPRSRFLDDIPHTVLDVRSDELNSKYGWLTSSSPQKSSWWQPSRPKQDDFSQDTGGDDANQDWLEHVEEAIEEGTRIEHRTLGIGTVISRRGDVIEVRFDSGVTKKLAMGIAPIKVAAVQN
jgi:DNA helicase II / ATP-dependent DNA helicase PcrA